MTPDGYNRIAGKLLETVFLGEVAQHQVIVGDAVLKVLEINPRERTDTKPGDAIELAVAPEDVVVLVD
jgi:hypothetical protein